MEAALNSISNDVNHDSFAALQESWAVCCLHSPPHWLFVSYEINSNIIQYIFQQCVCHEKKKAEVYDNCKAHMILWGLVTFPDIDTNKIEIAVVY